MLKKVTQKIDLFEYDNYRKYLRDLYTALKSQGNGFSFRFFSRISGFRSSNFLHLVMEGKRNLSSDSIDQLIKALNFNKSESIFFRNLVLLNQARNIEEKKFYAEQLISSSYYQKASPLKKAQYEYYSKWYLVHIRELVRLEGFQEDPEWIAHQLHPPITTQEAKKGLELLGSLGLIERNSLGKLVQADQFISTGDEVTSASISQFHRDMITKGAEAIDRFSKQERDVSCLTMGLSEKGAQGVKELIQRFRKELMAIAGQDDPSNAVYQVNFQFFPTTKRTTAEVVK